MAKQFILHRAGLIVLILANLGLTLYGALALVTPDILLKPFLLYIDGFPKDATKAYLEALFRLLGFFNCIPGVLGLLLLYHWHSSHEAWLLRTVIVSTILVYLGPMIFDNTVGSIGFFEIVEHTLFALVIILGVVLWKEQNEQRG